MDASDSVPIAVTIREQGAGDRDVVAQVVVDAFEEPEVGDLERALADRAGSVGYVACLDDEVVGHVRLTWGWLDARERLVDIVVLSPLSVAPGWQRRGVGKQLVARAIAGAEELGAPVVVLEGDPAYYSRCGFVAASTLGILPPSLRIPDRAFRVVALASHEPWMSGRVAYPDVFWQFDAVGLRGERLERTLSDLGQPG